MKVFTTAREHGKSVKQYLDELVPKWKEFCEKFRISNDYFYRTSDPDHHQGAQRVWKRCLEKGDIYKKYYEGYYCVGCEAFLLERDLVDGKCPNHGAAPVRQSEENYFFRLSKYSGAILEYCRTTPIF